MDFKEQILYELWGWDTFSSESYFCGRFETREEAEAEKDRAYSRDRPEENVAYLVGKLIANLNQKIDKMEMSNGGEIAIAPRSFKREVHMKLSNKGDCITFLAVGLRWAKKFGHCWLKYSWKINCETTRSSGCDCEKGTPCNTIEEFTQWLSTDNAPKEIAQ